MNEKRHGMKRFFVLLLLLLPLCLSVNAQTKYDEEAEIVYVACEYSPKFPGGEEALYAYFCNNLKYPEKAREENITGRVFITFIVERDGSLSNIKVLRDIGGGCGEEAVRVAKNMPKWKPGQHRGETVRVQYTMPVLFNFNENNNK